ncbi:hypothetical protein GS934_05185 [Rhodococcus hoagii]|nr:hypothetical protein [Prescottella equi]NKZ87202.1 hypothetical protein [Prescottella equi]
MTKKLVFSAWSSTPPAVASLLSYDTDRRIAAASAAASPRSTSLEQIGARLFGNGDSPVVPPPGLPGAGRQSRAHDGVGAVLADATPRRALGSTRRGPRRPGSRGRSRRRGTGGRSAAGRPARPPDEQCQRASAPVLAWPLSQEPGLVYLLRSMDPAELAGALHGHDPAEDEAPSSAHTSANSSA